MKNKKIKLQSSSSPASEVKSKIFPKTELEEPVEVTKMEEDSEATDIEEESTDAGEFALEMGLVCVVCKQIDFTPGNQPVECSECHNLYHQECHKPPITERDVSDPRNIWYCAKCTKNMEKMSKKTAKANIKNPILTNSASFQSAVNSGRETAFQLIKAAKAESAASSSNVMQPFKRVEMKPSQSSVGSSATNTLSSTPSKTVGLAGFAANLNRTASTLSNSSISSLTSLSTANNNNSYNNNSNSNINNNTNNNINNNTNNNTNTNKNNNNTGNSVNNNVTGGVSSVGSTNPSTASISLALSPVSSSSANSVNTLSKADKRIQQMKKKAAAKKILSK